MEVTLTCENCSSGIHVYPTKDANIASCKICSHEMKLHFQKEHFDSILEDCPFCERRDFYSQKDFNRKIGVILFVIAAILSIWTYGVSFVVLWVFDLILYKKLKKIAICYNCQSIFRGASNIEEIGDFDHEMNDRIVYSGHKFNEK